MSRSKLNARQRKFVDNLMEGMSEVDAYEKAGYIGSRKNMRFNGSRLTTNDNVREEIERRIAASREKGRRWLAQRQEKAQEILDEIADREFENQTEVKAWSLKQRVAKDIMDRNGLKPKDQHEIDMKGDQPLVFISHIPRPVDEDKGKDDNDS